MANDKQEILDAAGYLVQYIVETFGHQVKGLIRPEEASAKMLKYAESTLFKYAAQRDALKAALEALLEIEDEIYEAEMANDSLTARLNKLHDYGGRARAALEEGK